MPSSAETFSVSSLLCPRPNHWTPSQWCWTEEEQQPVLGNLNNFSLYLQSTLYPEGLKTKQPKALWFSPFPIVHLSTHLSVIYVTLRWHKQSVHVNTAQWRERLLLFCSGGLHACPSGLLGHCTQVHKPTYKYVHAYLKISLKKLPQNLKPRKRW